MTSILPSVGERRSRATAFLCYQSSRRSVRAVGRWAACVCASSLLLQTAAFAQDASTMPAGEGRELVVTQCVACHPLSTTLIKRASGDAWAETVARMVTMYMAPITESDADLMVSYLATHYGEDSASYDPGQQMLADECFPCHGEGMWSDLRTDRRGWESVLYRMIGRGALWTTDQVAVMADYLTDTYPTGESQ